MANDRSRPSLQVGYVGEMVSKSSQALKPGNVSISANDTPDPAGLNSVRECPIGRCDTNCATARAVRMLSFAISLNEDWAWRGLSTVFQARLQLPIRIQIAASGLASLPAKRAIHVMQQFCFSAGIPIPPFLNALDEATTWAKFASIVELESYLLVCFRELPENRKRDFVRFAQMELENAQ